MTWLPSGGLTFQAGLSVGEVLPVPRSYPSVPPQPRSALPRLQAQPAAPSPVSSPSTAPASAARSMLWAWCQTGLVGLLLPSRQWPRSHVASRALAATRASSHASWDLSAPQTLILRMATSGVMGLLLPDSGVETADFSEDDR